MLHTRHAIDVWLVYPLIFCMVSVVVLTKVGAAAYVAGFAPEVLNDNWHVYPCKGSQIIPAATWSRTRILGPVWFDLDLGHSRIMRNIFLAIAHNNALEEHADDCGFGLAIAGLIGLRALEYDSGPEEALPIFGYLQALLKRLEPHKEDALSAGWLVDRTYLKPYAFLLGAEPKHDCYGTGLKFFVYSLPDLTRGVLHCHHGQWGLEALVPHWLRRGTCLTEDATQADYYFVAWHTWCDGMVHNLTVDGGDIARRYLDIMSERDQLLPYWSKREGRDHIFLFSDQGLNFFPDWREHIAHSIFLLTEALTPGCGVGCFNPWKDIVVPGHTDFFRYQQMRKLNRPSEERSLLFNFHGRHPGLHHYYKHNKVRGKIIEVFTGKPGVSVGGFTDDYFERMGDSHFCLIPMGTSAWTNHLYEAFFAGCIPVILSDDFEVAFQGDLDWPSFSIKWPMADVSMRLYNFLLSTPHAELRRMKEAVDRHACWFDYHRTLESAGSQCSPYAGIIRALELRKGQLLKLPGPFWHHESI